MYLYDTFHLAKNWDVTLKAQEGVVEELLKTNHQMSFLG